MIRNFIYIFLFLAVNNVQGQTAFKNKISLNAYSFHNLLRQYHSDPAKGISLKALLDFCAEHNFDAVDLTAYYFPGYPQPPADSFIYSIKKKAHALGLEISGTGVRNDFANIDPPKRAADVQLVKDWIDVAAKLGAPVVRIFSGNIPKGYENKWDSIAVYMAKDIRECADYAQEKGILLGIQNHNDFLKTSGETIKLLQLINHDWVGVVADIGSFPTKNPYRDIKNIMPYAVNFQFKEYVTTINGVEKTDVKKILKIVKNSKYRGYLPIETLPDPADKSKTYDPLQSVPQFLALIKTAMRN